MVVVKMRAVEAKGLFLFILVATMVSVVIEARIANNDAVWKKRAKEADKATQQAYRRDPHKVVHQVNNHVHEAVGNSTRRGLSKYTGPCMATNPIDQCWRCHNDWEQNRFRLADCAIGFGSKAIGGKGGKFYVVNDSSDSDLVNPIPGTLRHAVIQSEPLWIIFAHSMVIRLSEELIMTSDKTIDGRGVNVHIAGGASLMLQFVKNIIIHGLHIHDIIEGRGGIIRDSVSHCGQRSKSDGDGVSIFGSSNIWVDHLSMWNCYDGLIDAVAHSTAITISNCHFTRHNEAMLFGASDSDSGDSTMQITVAFNHFGEGLIQRLPRARWGFVHVVNNDYTHWKMFAIGGSCQPTMISQGNRFRAPPNRFAKEVTKRDDAPESVWKNWLWRSEGDLLLNGAFFVQSGDPAQTYAKNGLISPKPGSFVAQLTRFAGALNCIKGSPC